MIKNITTVLIASACVLYIFLFGYKQGNKQGVHTGYADGLLEGIKFGHIQELINQGYSVQDARYIYENRNLDTNIQEKELR